MQEIMILIESVYDDLSPVAFIQLIVSFQLTKLKSWTSRFLLEKTSTIVS